MDIAILLNSMMNKKQFHFNIMVLTGNRAMRLWEINLEKVRSSCDAYANIRAHRTEEALQKEELIWILA